MNPTNDISQSQICLAVWSGYRSGNDKSTGPPPNASGSSHATTSPSRSDPESTTSTIKGDTGETWRLQDGGGSDASDGESCLLREEDEVT